MPATSYLRSGAARYALVALAYVGAYALAGLWARDLTVTGGASPWFPGAGLALGLLVVGGMRFAPVIFLAEVIDAQLIFQVPFTVFQDLSHALAWTAVWAIAAVILRLGLGRPPNLRTGGDLQLFGVVGVVAAPALAGLAGYSVLSWSGVGSWNDFAEGWRAFAVGDAVGVAALTPAIIAVAARQRPLRPPPAESITPVTILQALAIAGAPFITMLFDGQRPGLLALTLVPVAWVALTRGFVATTIASLTAISATTIAAHAQLGDSIALTDVQLFLITVALLALGIAVVMRMFRRSQAELAIRASQDPLTGMANRPAFLAEVERRLDKGEQVAILFIDLDRFKLVNDTLGHELGDSLLTAIAGRLSRTAGEDDALIARFGGDEFTAVTSSAEMSAWIPGGRLAERVLEQIAPAFALVGKKISIDVSVGIAVGEPGDDPEELISQADLAMFAAKQRGGSCISVFDETMSARAERRARIERGLRDALDAGRFRLVYQPIVPLSPGAPAGVESLLRWHEDGEPIPPDEFIPIAEETGMILRIGRWVLTEACRTAAAWSDADGPPPTIWVNASAAELREPDFVEFVISSLEQAGLEGGGRLGLELTENILVDDTEAIIDSLGRLRDAGVRLALDDFGTGYSSLGYLRRLPIDTIKIDRRFIAGLDDPTEQPVAAMITDLAHRLGLVVVGEGVETTEQREALERLGCDLAQGYLLGRPGPSDRAVAITGFAGATSG
jgi:diguanylate cyclase (GGDEF)-like protein